MFEGSLVESQGRVITASERWTALGSMTLQCAIAGLLIAVPLMRPETLSMVRDVPKLFVPLVPKPPVQVQRVEPAASSSTAMSVPVESAAPMLGRRISLTNLAPLSDGLTPSMPGQMNMAGSLPVGFGIGGNSTGPAISVTTAPAAAPAKRVNVSAGVTTGMLLAPIQPVYPRIAIAAHIEGTVVMEAIISKAGRIESLRVVSGSPMLQNAALDAVRAARYRPYLLNGEPTEVQTTISVIFRMGS
jgi:periplasmic protein TonB